VHRENYEVPKGQEQSVHVKIAKVTSDGTFLEPARIIHEEPKFFETVAKRNLETLGYTVEILYHPQGKYSSVRIVDKDAQLQAVQSEVETLKAKNEAGQAALSEKDAEIARLKAELAKAHGKPEAKAKKESKKEEK
jgi:uncharacterized protein with GYD domain